MDYTAENGTITINGESLRYEIRGNRLLLFVSDETSPCDYYLEFVAE
ncbi:hypothetical protein OO013_04485 [Mangrovivirga sp. M17]|uniref:Uncharacterized protein n=1 Tax=Mangrovivirga halotolerans TaxID=2993936 RepID=A0ABT3RMR6_9BACT|nr:hypothetical protein [Mangrovivirga halotolerans]MCX2743108.1 hypothetical protein [Mangrovivirga halotolerans]